MRVKAPLPNEAAVYMTFPVVTVPAVWEAFARQADVGEARWGGLVNAPEVVAAQPPPALPPGAQLRLFEPSAPPAPRGMEATAPQPTAQQPQQPQPPPALK
jgi:hypothetical protein